jgi:hypothetical protein
MSPAYPFLLFAGEHYYPNGGWGDFRGAYATVDEARAGILARQHADAAAGLLSTYEWYEIVDVRTLTVVAFEEDVPFQG